MLQHQMLAVQRQWANGEYTGSNIDETIQLNSAAIGRTLVLKELIEMSWEDFLGAYRSE